MADEILILYKTLEGITINNLRALFQRLTKEVWVESYIVPLWRWESSNGLRLHFREKERIDITPPTRVTWIAQGSRPGSVVSAIARVEVYEEKPYELRLEFCIDSDVKEEPFGQAFEEFSRVIIEQLQPMPSGAGDGKDVRLAKNSTGDKGSMSKERERRANKCKELKDAHSDWSYAKVAMEAARELGEEVWEYDVRNDYRAMGWVWERADRIR